MDDLKLIALATAILAVMVFLWFVGDIISSDLLCLQRADEHPCFENTIKSSGFGSCECVTEAGPIEWKLGIGCDLD